MHESFNTSKNITHINLLELYYGYDKVFAYVLYVIYVAVSTWCIFANSVLLVVIIKSKVLHTHANVFVCNIAASDICVGLSIMFIRPFDLLTNASVQVARTSCLFFIFTGIFTNMTSIHALLCATCERYIKICHPYQSHRIMKVSVIVPVISFSWIISLVLTALLLIRPHWHPESQCHFTSVVNLTVLIICAPYPTLLMIFLCYFNIRIFWTVRRHRKLIQVSGEYY